MRGNRLPSDNGIIFNNLIDQISQIIEFLIAWWRREHLWEVRNDLIKMINQIIKNLTQTQAWFWPSNRRLDWLQQREKIVDVTG